jgi:hypothetical protein
MEEWSGNERRKNSSPIRDQTDSNVQNSTAEIFGPFQGFTTLEQKRIYT